MDSLNNSLQFFRTWRLMLTAGRTLKDYKPWQASKQHASETEPPETPVSLNESNVYNNESVAFRAAVYSLDRRKVTAMVDPMFDL